ncbi:MAG: FtsW/RodA/SpoVE family cell cycle protein [Dehalococcoidia bacterium]
MVTQQLSLRLGSPARNLELGLLCAAAGLVVLGWRSLEVAGSPLPSGTSRIVTQFLLTAFAGNVALRAAAPRATPALYPAAMVLAAIGLIATLRLAPSAAEDQVRWISLGVALMAAAAAMGSRARLLQRLTYTSGALAVAILFATGAFGTTLNGARLWVSLGGQLVQTTELIKVLLVLFFAGFLAGEGRALERVSTSFGGRTYSALPALVPLLLVLGVVLGTLALLKDLGSVALLLALTVAAAMLATGRAWLAVAGAVLLFIAGSLGYVAFDHVQERIDTWRDPYADPLGSGYQTLQSTYAIQSGGVTGEGWGRGTAERIPAAATDYVFSGIAEALGVAGAAGLIGLYAAIGFVGLRVARDASSAYERLVAALSMLLICIQAAIIIAGNLRLVPTTGITLPFVSYGGSSLVVNFVLVGIVLAISASRHEAGARPSRP